MIMRMVNGHCINVCMPEIVDKKQSLMRQSKSKLETRERRIFSEELKKKMLYYPDNYVSNTLLTFHILLFVLTCRK